MVKPLVKLGLRSRPAATYAGIRRAEPLILRNIRQGACFRVKKLRLYRKDENQKFKDTDFFLSGTITRIEDEFYCEFRADFGPHPPRSAHFAINEDNPRLQPLVQNGIPLQHSPVKLTPSANAEIIELHILTDGSATIPGELYAVVRNTERNTQNGDDTNPTLPLVTPAPACPSSLGLEQAIALGQALKASSHPHLQTLGELFEAKILDERKIYIGQLVNRKADLRLIEAAAKIICLNNPMMDLEKTDLNDPAMAYLAAFHSQVPVHLLYSDFFNAFEKARNLKEDPWNPIAKITLLALLEAAEGRRHLQDLVNTYFLTDDRPAGQLLRRMIDWGKRKIDAPALDLSVPSADCLNVISGPDEGAGLRAAIEYLRYYGFIRISDLLD